MVIHWKVVLKMIFDEQAAEEMWKIVNNEINRRTWLYKIGLQETHGILYVVEYGSWFHENQW